MSFGHLGRPACLGGADSSRASGFLPVWLKGPGPPRTRSLPRPPPLTTPTACGGDTVAQSGGHTAAGAGRPGPSSGDRLWAPAWYLWGCPVTSSLCSPPPESWGVSCHPACGPPKFGTGGRALCPAWLEPQPCQEAVASQACDQAGGGGPSTWGLTDQAPIPPQAWSFAESSPPPLPESGHFCWVMSQRPRVLPGAKWPE